MRFLEISGNFHHELDVYTTSFHHVFTTFHYIYTTNLHHKKFSRHLFTTFSLQIFTTEGRTDRDEQTPWGRTDRFSLHIYTTNLHYTFSPQIFTTNFHYEIYTTDFHHDIYTTNFHHEFSLRIFTTTFTLQIYTTVIVVIKIKFIIHT